MVTNIYPEHKALNSFFDVVMEGLKGLVDVSIIATLSLRMHNSSAYIGSPVGRR